MRSSFLTEPERPLRAILLAWPLVSIPALGLAAVAAALFPSAPPPSFPGNPWVTFVNVTVLGSHFEVNNSPTSSRHSAHERITSGGTGLREQRPLDRHKRCR